MTYIALILMASTKALAITAEEIEEGYIYLQGLTPDIILKNFNALEIMKNALTTSQMNRYDDKGYARMNDALVKAFSEAYQKRYLDILEKPLRNLGSEASLNNIDIMQSRERSLDEAMSSQNLEEHLGNESQELLNNANNEN